MVIAKTPFRISFFGGGTDHPEFFRQYGGAVLATAIDKCIYHCVTKFHSDLFDYAIRIAYRKVECVNSVDEIMHAPFREVLRSTGIEKDIEITLTADLPSYSGLGSSSSFVVGLLNALAAFQGRHLSKKDLSLGAIGLERDILGETVGYQDQILAAYGGFNLVEFHGEGDFSVHRVPLSQARLAELEASTAFYFTGITRCASLVEKNKITNLDRITDTLRDMLGMVDRAVSLLANVTPLSAFGELLHENWQAKRSLDVCVSTPEIDRMYATARAAGALGGKLLGAGGGGFMLFFVPPERRSAFRQAMNGYNEVPISFGSCGSSIIHS